MNNFVKSPGTLLFIFEDCCGSIQSPYLLLFFVRVGNINDLFIVEIRKKSNANSLIRNIYFAYLYLQFGASGRLVGGNRLIR